MLDSLNDWLNHQDGEAVFWIILAAALCLFAFLLWIEHAWETRRLARLEQRYARQRQSDSYATAWQEAEDRFWQKLDGAGQDDLDALAEELAIIRAHRFGVETLDLPAARRAIRSKLQP
jgi:hypothetical protein